MRTSGVGALLLAGLAACSSPYSPAEKEASFDAHRDARLEAVPVAQYLRTRTALLLRSVRLTAVTLDEGALRLQAEQAPGAPGSLGTAVPLTPDGYYLTAAHCISASASGLAGGGRWIASADDAKNAVVAIVVTDGRDVRHAQARVVWTSAEGDLALLHATALPFALLPWQDGDVPPGSPVFAAGFPCVMSPADRPSSAGYGGPSAGACLGPGEVAGDHLEIRHDAPLASGDSGGPLVSAQGRLIGVNTRIAGGFLRRGPSIALRPVREKLLALIAADRARR
jgi:S1-C subfamily serine protease